MDQSIKGEDSSFEALREDIMFESLRSQVMTYGVNPGDRVGALISVSETQVTFLGYGVYEGDFVLPHEVEYPGMTEEEILVMNDGMGDLPNPRIKLDNGDIIWGCECWWDKEDDVRSEMELFEKDGVPIKTISIAEYRAEVLQMVRDGCHE